MYSGILPQIYFLQNHVSLGSESARNGQGTIGIMMQDKKLITYLDENLSQYKNTDDLADAPSGSCFEEHGKIRVIQG